LPPVLNRVRVLNAMQVRLVILTGQLFVDPVMLVKLLLSPTPLPVISVKMDSSVPYLVALDVVLVNLERSRNV